MRIFSRLILVLAGCVFTAHGGNNVLLIIADDFGLDASSVYNTSAGASVAPTPNIASLAAGGVKFNNAYAYPVCSPTRSAILTGRFGFRTGTGNVFSMAAANALKASETTLPDVFAANAALGVQLKQFGKWHLGGGNIAPGSLGGWPAFAGSLAGEVSSYTSWTKVVTNGTPAGTSSSTVTTYATTDIVNDAVAWIALQNGAQKPWVAWVAFNAPHTPFHLPVPTTLCPHYSGLSGLQGDINANPRNYYNAAVEAMDTEIGRLLAAVDFAKTTVIFIGDNGTPGQVLQTPYSAGHGKDSLYEGGIRVPMIIRGPDVVSPGRTSDTFVHVVDLFSTTLALAGAPLPGSVVLDSQSLLPILKNETVTRARIFSEEFDTSDTTLGGRALRDDRYKIIRNRTGTDEFYDLLSDPYETSNLLAAGVGSMSAANQSFYYRLRFQLGGYTALAKPTVGAAGLAGGSFTLTTPQSATAVQSLWRCTDLTGAYWSPVPGATSIASGGNVTFTDPTPPTSGAFYSAISEVP